MLLANKPTIVRQAAATAGPEDEKIKKFATAIVEFSKVKKTKRQLFHSFVSSCLVFKSSSVRKTKDWSRNFHADDVALPRSV